MCDLNNLMNLYQHYLQEGGTTQEKLDVYIIEAAELAELQQESGEEPTMARGVSPATLAFYRCITNMGDQRQPVEFVPCGHVLWWTVPMIIAAGGFRQLLEIENSTRFSAPTFSSVVCGQCDADAEQFDRDMATFLNMYEDAVGSTSVDRANFIELYVGQILRYVAGRDDWHVEAIVEVSQQPYSGDTGCWVKVLSYDVKGSSVDHNVGDEIIAGRRELFLMEEVTE